MRGLGSLNAEVLKTWQTMAARMVDAQAPGLGFRVSEAAAAVNGAADWPERTLQRLGQLQLLCEALRRRDRLTPEEQADLRAAVGWPFEKADVLASGERLADRWAVLGIAIEERDDKLTERRVWLHGKASGRRAWLLDHALWWARVRAGLADRLQRRCHPGVFSRSQCVARVERGGTRRGWPGVLAGVRGVRRMDGRGPSRRELSMGRAASARPP